MGKEYIYTYKDGGVGTFETILTGGTAIIAQDIFDKVSDSHNHGIVCKAWDQETDLSVACWGATKEKARAKAKFDLDEKIENFLYEKKGDELAKHRASLSKENSIDFLNRRG